MKIIIFVCLLQLLTAITTNAQQTDFPKLTGPYLGQKPPGMIPELFAPGIVSTMHHEHSSPTFSPDGRTMFWSVHYPDNSPHPRPILLMTLEHERWTEPRIASFVKKNFIYENPFFPVDGTRLYFSAAQTDGKTLDYSRSDLWYVEYTASGWSEQTKLGSPPNSDNMDGQPSVTRDGTLYFISFYKPSRVEYALFCSRLIEGRYSLPTLLQPKFNSLEADWTPYIAPDERYLIFSSFRKGGFGMGDLYISFRNPDGSWDDVINLGARINTERNERFPNVTPDGKYFFFNSTKQIPSAGADRPGNGNGDVYWVSTKVIEELKPKELK